jgi:sugar phosphate permease
MRRWRINIFAVTWISYAGYYFCRKTFGIVKRPLRDHLWPEDAACGQQLADGLVESCSMHDLEIAHIWTAFLLAYMCGQFLAAYMGRQVACRRLLLTGMGVSLVANFIFGFLTIGGSANYSLMIVFMVINGLAQATGWPGNVGLLAKWTRRQERGTMMGVWATCYQLGSIFAKLFAGVMFTLFGLAWSFWGASIVLLVIWTLFYFLGKERPEDVGLDPMSLFEVVEVETIDALGKPVEPKSDRTVMVMIVGMGLCYFCFKFLRYAFDSWAPMIIEESFGTTTAMAATASTVFDWVGFLGVFVAGVASDRLFKSKRMPVIVIMSLGLFIGTIAIGSVGTTSFFWFVVLTGLIGFMLMGPDSLLSGTAAMDVGSAKMAVIAAGVINGLGSIGPVIQEEVIGYLRVTSGMDAVFNLFIAVGGMAVVGTGLLWAMSRKLKINL